MALAAAHLNAGVILVVTVTDRYIISLPLPLPPPPHPLPPISPSLISLVVCVDVKHRVCLLTSSTGRLELFQAVLRNMKLHTGGKTQYNS